MPLDKHPSGEKTRLFLHIERKRRIFAAPKDAIMITDPFNYSPEVVILSGGDYPSHPYPTALLQEAKQVACCDSAAFEYIRRGGNPWRIVGDCDSIFSPKDEEERRILEEHRDIIRRIEEQDDNDQTKTVRYCLEHGLHRMALVGATGGREDHTLGNISLLMEYQKMGAEVRLYTDHGVFIPCHDRIELEVPIPDGFVAASDKEATRQKSTQISIFNITATQLKSQGLRYPLYDFTQWWQGTLNEAVSNPVIIEGKGDFLLFVNFTL